MLVVTDAATTVGGSGGGDFIYLEVILRSYPFVPGGGK